MERSRAGRDDCSGRNHIPSTCHLEESMIRRPPSSPHPSLHPSHRRTRAAPRRVPVVLLVLVLLVLVLLVLLVLLLLVLPSLQSIQSRQRAGRKRDITPSIPPFSRQPLITAAAPALLLLLLRIRRRRKATFQSSPSSHTTTTTSRTARQGQIIIHRQTHTILPPSHPPPPLLPSLLPSSSQPLQPIIIEKHLQKSIRVSPRKIRQTRTRPKITQTPRRESVHQRMLPSLPPSLPPSLVRRAITLP